MKDIKISTLEWKHWKTSSYHLHKKITINGVKKNKKAMMENINSKTIAIPKIKINN